MSVLASQNVFIIQVLRVGSPSKIEGVRGSMNTSDTASDEGKIDKNIILPPAPSILEGEFVT